MFGFSIVLLLTCGFIVIQAAPRGNVNANKNTNIMSRRNYNSNSNNNILGRGPRHSPYIDEDTEFEPQLALQEIRDKLYAEGDTEGAMIVTAAADAVLAITKTLMEELSGTTALAVADAVAEILKNRLSRASRNYRRNANYNTNTNTNIVRRDNVKQENELPLDYPYFDPAIQNKLPVYALRSLESGEMNDGGPQSIIDDMAALGLTRKGNDVLNEEESQDLVQTLLDELEGETGENEDQIVQLPARRGMSSNRNSNSNVNSNQLNYRRNYNSNSNKNSFRRSNVNSNVNNNKIHSRRYRRD